MASFPTAVRARPARPSSRVPFVALVLALTMVAGACMDDSPFVPKIEDTVFAPELGVDLDNSTKTSSGLYYRDIAVGNGAEVPATGALRVTTNYSLYLRTGTSIETGTITFPTPQGGSAIPGFDEGVRGMRVGGTRQLIIPPRLGYGDQAVGTIPANSILVFTVTLTSIN